MLETGYLTTCYDPKAKTGGIFTEYINTFLKGKQQASGFPSHVKTDEQKTKYIDDYYNREGISLEKELISKNEAQRFVYKLALNSMWGRLGMNMDRTQFKLINDSNNGLK